MSDDQIDFLKVVDENARRLLTLINDLLTLSGIEGGRLLLRHEAVDVRGVVERHLTAMAGAIRDKQLALGVDLPADAVVAEVDPERLGQVITNLVTNAVKFTPEGGTVTVTLRRDGDRLALAVSDTGIGIAGEDTDQLFQRFFRARNAIDAAVPGTGLGLAICKGIVDAHGGSIAVESEIGSGTTITAFLPMTVATT